MNIESNQKAYLVILVFFGITFSGYGQGKSAEKKINVVFRYDDYSANSITSAELEIIDAFRKNKAAITFGVIPFKVAGDVHDPSPQDLLPLDSVKGEILKTGFEEMVQNNCQSLQIWLTKTRLDCCRGVKNSYRT